MGNIFTDANVASGGSPALCTRAQVKARLGIAKSDDDERIDAIIASILPTFCARYGREFMPHVTTTRTFPVKNYLVVLGAVDLRAVTSVVLHPEGAAVELSEGSDYILGELDPLTGTCDRLRLSNRLSLASARSDNFGSAQVAIDAEWGIWASDVDVPADVNSAAIDTALAWLDRPSSDIAMLGGGDPRFMAPATPQTWDIPASAYRKMLPYSRNMGVW